MTKELAQRVLPLAPVAMREASGPCDTFFTAAITELLTSGTTAELAEYLRLVTFRYLQLLSTGKVTQDEVQEVLPDWAELVDEYAPMGFSAKGDRVLVGNVARKVTLTPLQAHIFELLVAAEKQVSLTEVETWLARFASRRTEPNAHYRGLPFLIELATLVRSLGPHKEPPQQGIHPDEETSTQPEYMPEVLLLEENRALAMHTTNFKLRFILEKEERASEIQRCQHSIILFGQRTCIPEKEYMFVKALQDCSNWYSQIGNGYVSAAELYEVMHEKYHFHADSTESPEQLVQTIYTDFIRQVFGGIYLVGRQLIQDQYYFVLRKKFR